MIFICYSKCGTCKKARKYLDDLGLSYEERDIKQNNPTYEELKEWYHSSNYTLKSFFNTSGIIYRDLQLKDKLKELSEEEQLRLLSQNGMLVKRPIIVKDSKIILGFDKEEYNKL